MHLFYIFAADAAPQDIASSLNEEESRDGEEVEEAHNAEEEDTVINEQATSHKVEETGWKETKGLKTPEPSACLSVSITVIKKNCK